MFSLTKIINWIRGKSARQWCAWHCHQEQDELFMILKGNLVMEYKDKKVHLKLCDLHVVPKGVMHNPLNIQLLILGVSAVIFR